MDQSNVQPRMSVTHLLSRYHGDDGDALLPHHLPEVLTRVVQRALCGDVVPLLSAHRDLRNTQILNKWILRLYKASDNPYPLCKSKTHSDL